MATTEENQLIQQVESALREQKVMKLLSDITEAAIDWADHIDAEEIDNTWNAVNQTKQQRSTTHDRVEAGNKLQEIRKLVRELHNL